MNFKNANSPAAFKRNRINDMIKDSKDNNELGRKMENSAKTFLKEATAAFDNLNTEHTTMEGKSGDIASIVDVLEFMNTISSSYID